MPPLPACPHPPLSPLASTHLHNLAPRSVSSRPLAASTRAAVARRLVLSTSFHSGVHLVPPYPHLGVARRGSYAVPSSSALSAVGAVAARARPSAAAGIIACQWLPLTCTATLMPARAARHARTAAFTSTLLSEPLPPGMDSVMACASSPPRAAAL